MYSAHRKLWSGSEEGRTTVAHTHRGECGQKVPRLKKGLQRERNLQLGMATERVTRNRTGPEPLGTETGTGTVRDRFRTGPNRGTMKPPEKKVVGTVKPPEKNYMNRT